MFGLIPAVRNNLGSIDASILGSRPKRAGFIPPNIPAIEAAEDVEGALGEACGIDAAEDLLGVDLPSLLSLPSFEEALALDGG